MIKEVIASGKNIIEAKENARAALGANPLDDVNFEVIHSGSRGIFGIIGVKPAQVRAYIEIPDPVEKTPRRHEKQKAEKREGNNNKKKNDGAKKAKSTEKSEPKKDEPKPAAIPEDQLKLEKREVKDGEDMSYDFVKTLVSDIGLSAECELYSCEDGTRRIIISGDDASVLIGHHGDTLDALQYLTGIVSAKSGEKHMRVYIDTGSYRARREEALERLAKKCADRVLKTGRSLPLEPMNPNERRIVHMVIQNIDGLESYSKGEGAARRVVITPKR